MQPFCTCFCQSVGEGLEEHLAIVVSEEGFSLANADRGGKNAYLILHRGRFWAYEVTETQAGSVVVWNLLAQHRNTDFCCGMYLSALAKGGSQNNDVVSIAIGGQDFYHRLDSKVRLQLV